MTDEEICFWRSPIDTARARLKARGAPWPQERQRNKRTLAQIAQAEGTGLMPLDYMVSVMRAETVDVWQRLELASLAVPYMNAKLKQIEIGDTASRLRRTSPSSPIEYAQLKGSHDTNRTRCVPQFAE